MKSIWNFCKRKTEAYKWQKYEVLSNVHDLSYSKQTILDIVQQLLVTESQNCTNASVMKITTKPYELKTIPIVYAIITGNWMSKTNLRKIVIKGTSLKKCVTVYMENILDEPYSVGTAYAPQWQRQETKFATSTTQQTAKFRKNSKINQNAGAGQQTQSPFNWSHITTAVMNEANAVAIGK